MESKDLLPKLFRSEFRKIVSVLVKRMGLASMEAAEDIASDTFVTALNVWPYRGTPENPAAWLYTVAKNKAKNHIRDILLSQKKVDELTDGVSAEQPVDLSEKNIFDSQLQMMFALTHPAIPQEAQVALALRILGGLGIEEIANAFLTNKETINKRLSRARERLRSGEIPLEFPSEQELPKRLHSVVTTLYLLFGEGYYSESNEFVLREDLCIEAMRLMYMLTSHPSLNTPEVNAALALMCFHSSRFPARKGSNGELILYDDQDESLWNRELIDKGTYYLHLASRDGSLSRFHFEAAIAYWHTRKEDSLLKWENILELYNKLLTLHYTPVAAMNRTFALSKVRGKDVAIKEAEKLALNTNPYYFTLLGELYFERDKAKSIGNFRRALQVARTAHDRKIIEAKLERTLKAKQ